MPELPEVNTFKLYFESTSLHQKIARVVVDDAKIIRNVTGQEFIDKLTNRTFQATYRRGKYLFGQLDNDHHVLFHFGMTGDFSYYDHALGIPRHERFRFEFENGNCLGFICPRKFARIAYLNDLGGYIEKQRLGEDALIISEEAFLQAMEGKKASIKGFLLDQSNVAGVGNLYADEICIQARIHPATSVEKISKTKRKEAFQKMKAILQHAVEQKPYYKEYPADWFWQWRVEGQLGPNGYGPVKKTKVAGRTTYFESTWQQKR